VSNDRILEAIFRHAHSAPDKVALYYLDRRISFVELAFWIVVARDFLGRQDLRPGSIAALVRVPDVFDGWALRLALHSLGLTTVDLASADEFGAYQLRNIGCVITTIQDQSIEVPDAEYKLVRIPDSIFFGKQAGPVPEMPRIDVPAGGHILLTSGTTGFKKKVLRDAEGTWNDVPQRRAVYSIFADSIFHANDFTAWTAAGYLLPIWAWSCGAAAVCHRGRDVHRSFQMERITHAMVTPVKLQELLASPQGELRFHPEMSLFVTAAPLTAALASAAKSRLTPNVFHMLASTEGKTVAVTRIERPEDVNEHILVSDSDVQIVDDAGKPLPSGHAGMIRVRPNEGVQGYLDDEEATRRFFRDGYFYPGDIGEIRADGRLIMHGRTTSTINLGGEKRPVEFLEQLLQDRLDLDGICLISIRSPSLEDELHIVVQSDRPIGKDEVTKALAHVAGLGSVPGAHLHRVDVISRNEMGKIDRAAIRQQISALLTNRPAA
jgi:acyl-CoA synthetase (AMP-forming)/AMP-acid ligase II